MSQIKQFEKIKSCSSSCILAVNEALNALIGKWKLPIIASLLYGSKRFSQMEKEISGITPRMLSKELKELEINGIVRRNVYDSMPVTVEYELTHSGKLLQEVLDAMIKWGMQHRKSIIAKSN
jgi:DNA-binding HxlR family transcriptional regulator